MNDLEALTYMGTDGRKWAEEFCKIAKDHGHRIDEGWVIGWFANAIEAGREAGRRRGWWGGGNLTT
jgi:hypothetical protein